MSCQYNCGAFTPTHEAAIPEAGRWSLGVTHAVIEASGSLPNANFGCLWCRCEARRQIISSPAPRVARPPADGAAGFACGQSAREIQHFRVTRQSNDAD